MEHTKCSAFIAHRGLSANTKPYASYMENTIPAIQQAMKLGYKGVEVDIQLTADKIPVLWHDDSICIGKPSKTIDLTMTNYKDLKRIIRTNVLYRDAGKVLWEPSNKRLDNLATVLRKFPGTLFCLELKIASSRQHDTLYKYELVHHVLKTILSQKHNHAVFLSFDIDTCKLLRKYSPFKVMLLTENDINRAAYLARRYKLNGVVFDGNMTRLSAKSPLKETTDLVEWWTYNANKPFTKVAIIDIVNVCDKK